MKTIMTLLLGLGLSGVAGIAAAAPTDQLWFTGKRAPQDAFSAGAGVVHLRWGVTEGTLPADVVGFAVDIEDETIYQTAAHPRPAAGAVAEAYAPFPRHRALAVARIRDAGDAGDFATITARKIASRDANDAYWRQLAGRLDPVLAQLSGRGVMLREGNHGTYRLFAVAADERRALLGEVVIGAGAVRAQAPRDLAQITNLGRCDAPEAGRNHGVIALNWQLPGADRSVDRLSYSLDLAGFEVYRANSADVNFDPADFPVAAARASLDSSGMPQLDGLTRVNAAPIAPTPSPNGGKDARYQAWNPDFAQWLETADDVAKAGLAPGDRRTYYVVARDTAGNFGDAARIEVIVPDALTPPAPWGVRAMPQQTDERGAEALRLSWWHVDVRNFHDARPGRAWCNLATAAADGRLSFAGSDGDCTTPAGQVNVNVASYKVYRFDDQSVAANFTDTDGDGFSDADERDDRGGHLSLPGTACDPTRGPALNVINYLVRGAAPRLTRRGGRAVVELVDPLGDDVRKGTHYWYRIASVDVHGKVGVLSAPIRGFFPDLDKPARLDADALQGSYCPVRATTIPHDEGGGEAFDATGQAVEAEFFCTSANPGYRYAREPLVDVDGQRGVVGVRTPPGCDTRIRYLDASGRVVGQVTFVQPDPRRMRSFTATLAQDCNTLMRLVDGQTAPTPHLFRAPPTLPPGMCIDLMRIINGERERLTTLCEPNQIWRSETQLMSGAMACYSAQPVNINGVSGTLIPLPCVRSPEVGPPAPPSLTSFTFEGARGVVRWRAPAEHIGGILLEWRQVGSDTPRETDGSKYYTAPNAAPGDALDAIFDASALGADPERWCVRARSFGRGRDALGGASEWSPDVCIERTPAGVALPTFLGWPTVPKPRDAGTLAVRYLTGDLRPAIALSDLDTPVVDRDQCASFPNLFDCDDDTSCAGDGPRLFTGCDICAGVEAALGDNRRFVVYRQRREGDTHTAFAQISPRIDGMFCNTSCSDPFGCDPTAEDPVSIFSCTLGRSAEEACGVDLVPQGVDDPYVKLLPFDDDDDWPRLTLAFVDRTPHKSGAEYRYQVVYFDTRGEITSTRNTAWLQVP